MNNSTAEARIEAHLKTQWETSYPSNELNLTNQEGLDLEDLRGDMFMSAEISFDKSNQSAMVGNNSPYRVKGALSFDIYIPSGQGSRGATEVIDFMISTFNLKTITGIVFKTVQEVSKASLETVDLYRKSCIIDFTFDSFTP